MEMTTVKSALLLLSSDPGDRLGTRLAGISSPVVPKLYRGLAWRLFFEQVETVVVV